MIYLFLFILVFIVVFTVGILIATGVIKLGKTTTPIDERPVPVIPVIPQKEEPAVPQDSVSTTPPPVIAPPITSLTDENVKIDADCLSRENPPVLEDSYYTMSPPILGKDLKQNSRIEGFALTGTVVIDPRQLDPNTSYLVGTLQRSNTISEAKNGGSPCPAEFPTTIYRRL